MIAWKIYGISWLVHCSTKNPGQLRVQGDKKKEKHQTEHQGDIKTEHGSDCRQPQVQSKLTISEQGV